jgi:hypothetical protein
MAYNEDKDDTQELGAALGTPKYYIDTPGLAEGETYAWFPTTGGSMTDNTPKSIPSGSLVLGRRLKLNSISDIPLHRPIVVIIDDNGTQHCMLKSGCEIQKSSTQKLGADAAMLCLRSYNPATYCDDFWMPFSNIKFVFVVEKVRLPNGNEFVPKQEEVTRKRKGA